MLYIRPCITKSGRYLSQRTQRGMHCRRPFCDLCALARKENSARIPGDSVSLCLRFPPKNACARKISLAKAQRTHVHGKYLSQRRKERKGMESVESTTMMAFLLCYSIFYYSRIFVIDIDEINPSGPMVALMLKRVLVDVPSTLSTFCMAEKVVLY